MTAHGSQGLAQGMHGATGAIVSDATGEREGSHHHHHQQQQHRHSSSSSRHHHHPLSTHAALERHRTDSFSQHIDACVGYLDAAEELVMKDHTHSRRSYTRGSEKGREWREEGGDGEEDDYDLDAPIDASVDHMSRQQTGTTASRQGEERGKGGGRRTNQSGNLSGNLKGMPNDGLRNDRNDDESDHGDDGDADGVSDYLLSDSERNARSTSRTGFASSFLDMLADDSHESGTVRVGEGAKQRLLRATPSGGRKGPPKPMTRAGREQQAQLKRLYENIDPQTSLKLRRKESAPQIRTVEGRREPWSPPGQKRRREPDMAAAALSPSSLMHSRRGPGSTSRFVM